MTQQAETQGQGTVFPRPGKFEVGLLALVVLACSQISYAVHPREGPFIAAADVLCGLLFVVWAYRVTRQKRWRQVVGPPAAVWAWLVVAVLSISMAVLDAAGMLSRGGIMRAGLQIWQIALYFGLAYVMFVDVFNSAARVRRACAVLLGAVSVVLIWGLVDYLLQADPMDVKAGFGNRNVYSAFLVVTVPLLFGIAIHERNRPQRYWVFGVGALALLTMLGTPHVWLLTGLLCWLAYMRGSRMRGVAVPVIVALAVVVASALPRNHEANVVELFDIHERGELIKLGIAGVDENMEAEGLEDEEERPLIVKKRWLEWQPALLMMSDNLPLGVGAGNYQANINEAQYYGPLPNIRKIEPDTNNFYLVMGATMGLAGLICIIAMLARFWKLAGSLWLRANSRVERGLAAGLHGALAGIILANLFTSLLVRGVGILWALVFAVIAVAAREGLAQASEAGPQSGAQTKPPE